MSQYALSFVPLIKIAMAIQSVKKYNAPRLQNLNQEIGTLAFYIRDQIVK